MSADANDYTKEYAHDRDERLDQVAGIVRAIARTHTDAERAVRAGAPAMPTDRAELTDRERVIYDLGRRDALNQFLSRLALAIMGEAEGFADADAFAWLNSGTPAGALDEVLEGNG